jgi:hypothetical protein
MTKFTKFVLLKTLKAIAKEPEYLDFTTSSKLDAETK